MTEIRDSLTSATGFLLDENSSGTALVQIIKASDVELTEFLDYRQYLQDSAPQSFQYSKNGHLINTAEELQAFDDYLLENQDKQQLFVSSVVSL